MKANAAALAILLAFAPTTEALATNNYFLPGDAFFHTRLREKDLKRIDKEKDVEIHYAFPTDREEYLCGYAGYGVLYFTSMPKSFKDNLKLAYRDIRDHHPKKLVQLAYSKETYETNPPHLFLYNTTFDIQSHRLCLRYNEDWPKKTHALELFVKLPDAVMEEWRDSKDVKPLTVKYHPYKDRTQFSGEGTVHVRKGVRAILLPTSDFRSYYEFKEGIEVYEVTENSLTQYIGTGSSWKKKRYLKTGTGKWQDVQKPTGLWSAFEN